MFRSKLRFAIVLGIVMLLVAPMSACKKQPPPMPKIDLDQVDEAFRTTRGATFGTWMANFEWAVNQIYTGKSFVSLDARRSSAGRLLIINGYIERNRRPGYQLSDELIFRIVQEKGPWAFKYRVEDHLGWAPAHLQRVYRSAPHLPFYTSVILVSTWRPYYTPSRRLRLYRVRRAKYRRSAMYRRRLARAKKFRSKARRSARRRSRYRSRRSSRRSSRYRSRSRGSRGGKW